MKRIVYSLFLLICCVLLGSEAQAQFNWRHHGPEGIGSRTRTIIYDADGNLLAGSAGGGLWKSTNEGVTWTKVTSYDTDGGNPTITSMVRKGNTIYVGTGETEFLPFAASLGSRRTYDPNQADGSFGNMGLPGSGVFISNDNGASWSNDNATTKDFPTLQYDSSFVSIQKIIIAKSGRIFIASRRGLYYSDSPNLNDLKKSSGSVIFENLPIMDVAATDGGVILAAPSSSKYPSIIVDGNQINVTNDDSLYISNDNGVTFNPIISSALFDQNFFSRVRTRIEVAPSNPNVIYVASSRESSVNQLVGVWRSDDKGNTWKRYAPPGGPGFSPLGNVSRDAFTLAIQPEDEDKVIVAGNSWFTFENDRGWATSIQHFTPFFNNYLPRPTYCITFDPNNPKRMFVGTGSNIMRSDDGGETFTAKSKGYGGTITYSVTSVGLEGSESIISGTPFQGTILNNTWWREPYDQDANPSGPATTKGFGVVNRSTDGRAYASYLFPGSVLIQRTDGGVTRSDGTFGASFDEQIYGFPFNSDTSGAISALPGINTSDSWFIDRSNGTQEGGGLYDNGKLAPQSPWVMDEAIPDGVIGEPDASDAELKALPGKDSLQNIDHFLFFCSSKYVWIGNFVLGSPTYRLPDKFNPRWDRITNDLVNDPNGDEYFTAIAVTTDGSHTVYVGTSKGNIWRIKGSTDFSTYDATTNSANVTKISDAPGPIVSMKGRWISDLAIDPNDPTRLAITYAGYGGTKPPSYVWLATNIELAPNFAFMSKAPKEPTYAVEWVPYQPDPNDPSKIETALMIGTETGLYSATDVKTTSDFTAELPVSYGDIPVYDIYLRKYRSKIIDEETKEYRILKDNTLFIATHGYGIWSTSDTKLKGSRIGVGPTENSVTIDEFAVGLYPNPADETSFVKFDLHENAFVNVSMYGLDGRKIGTYANGAYDAGKHEQQIDTRSLNPGIYLIEVKIDGETEQHTKTLKAVIRR